MAIKKYVADADTTIVNAYQPSLTNRGTGSNMGEADVLEVFSIYGRQTTSSAELSRALIKFPVNTISTDRTNGVIPASGSVSFYLRMHDAQHSKAVPRDFKLAVLSVSQSWEEGIGLDLEGYADKTFGKIGCNWMSASKTAYWTDKSGQLLAGGSYHTSSTASEEVFLLTQSFSTGIEDLELDITPLVEQWIAGTYSNYGVGVHLSASYEAFWSGSANLVTSRGPPGVIDNKGADDTTQSVLYNPSGSKSSYYTKRFFARGSQYFFKRPSIEARWNDIVRDDRADFRFSSSLAPAADNLNTLYFYNYVRGQLTDIPNLGSDKRIYISIFSGSSGGFYGSYADNVAPADLPVSGTTGSIQILSADDGGSVRSGYLTVVTGGIVSTGIYSASFAFTGSSTLETIYDVWFTGSHNTINAYDALTQYFTGSAKTITPRASNTISRPSYYLNVTNLRNRYNSNDTVRFNLYVRNKNWSPTIYNVANSTVETTTIHSASYRVYRTLDAYEAVPYGTGSELHTGLSYDVSGNYFDFNMKLLEPGYEYAFKFAFYDNKLKTWIEQDTAFKFRVENYEY
jgi:hypothetical protein